MTTVLIVCALLASAYAAPACGIFDCNIDAAGVLVDCSYCPVSRAVIDLRSRGIQNINAGVFDRFAALQQLFLNGNADLTSLPVGVFNYTTKLTSL